MELKKLRNILGVIEEEVNKIEATDYATDKCKIEIVISKELWDELTEMSDLTADKYLHSNKMFGNTVCYQTKMPVDTFHIKYRIKEEDCD